MPKTSDIENFIRPLKGVSLSDTNAQDLRGRLSAYADLYAARAAPARAARRSLYLSLSSRSWGLALAVFMLLVGGTGVSFAAEDALPGQPLYAVKVSVSEPIEGALITTPVGKAKWQNVLTDRRLTEAATLATQNKLTPETNDYLQQKVTASVEQSTAGADELAAAGDDTDALAVRSDLEARLSAHVQLLSLIDPRLASAGDATTSYEVLAMLQQVQSATAQVTEARVAGEVAISDAVAASTSVQAPMREAKRAATMLAPAASPVPAPPSPAATAFMNAEDSVVANETNNFFRAKISLLAALPPATTTATSTATSTTGTSTTATSTDASSTDPITATSTFNSQQDLKTNTGKL